MDTKAAAFAKAGVISIGAGLMALLLGPFGLVLTLFCAYVGVSLVLAAALLWLATPPTVAALPAAAPEPPPSLADPYRSMPLVRPPPAPRPTPRPSHAAAVLPLAAGGGFIAFGHPFLATPFLLAGIVVAMSLDR